jgi:hypothetical protein
MSNIINLDDKILCRKANQARQGLAYYKKINADGKYDEAIAQTEKLLRSFYRKAMGKGPSLDEAA